jgi:hypothetical protein
MLLLRSWSTSWERPFILRRTPVHHRAFFSSCDFMLMCKLEHATDMVTAKARELHPGRDACSTWRFTRSRLSSRSRLLAELELIAWLKMI